MTRKPAPATSAAAAASTRANAASAPAKAAPKTSSKSVPAKALATKSGARAPAKAVAAKAAVKPAAKAAAKPPLKAAVKAAAKAPAKTAAKAPAKPAAKPAARSTAAKQPALALKNAAKALVKAAPPAGRGRAVQATPAVETMRPALVRDSFTMPDGEYAVLATVKQACLKAGFEIKKSELLRIGVALVGRLDTATLRQVLGSLPQLKTGRPPGQ